MVSGVGAGSRSNLSSTANSVSTTRPAGAQKFGQAVVVLRADDDIDRALAAQDLAPSAWATQPATTSLVASPRGGPRLLDLARLAELGIELFRRLLADMAGVEHDEIGVGDFGGLAIAFRQTQVGHALRVVDVHLAAERLDEYALAARPGGLGRLGGDLMGQKRSLLAKEPASLSLARIARDPEAVRSRPRGAPGSFSARIAASSRRASALRSAAGLMGDGLRRNGRRSVRPPQASTRRSEGRNVMSPYQATIGFSPRVALMPAMAR